MNATCREKIRIPKAALFGILAGIIVLAGCPSPSGPGESPVPADFVLEYEGSELPLTGHTMDAGGVVLGSSIGPLSFSITNGGEADLSLTGSPWAVLTGDTDQFSLDCDMGGTAAHAQSD